MLAIRNAFGMLSHAGNRPTYGPPPTCRDIKARSCRPATGKRPPKWHGLSTGVLDGNRPISPPRNLTSGDASSEEGGIDWPLGQGSLAHHLPVWFDWLPSLERSRLPWTRSGPQRPGSGGTHFLGSYPLHQCFRHDYGCTTPCREPPRREVAPTFHPGLLGSFPQARSDGPAPRASRDPVSPEHGQARGSPG